MGDYILDIVKIFGLIQEDIEKIESQLENRNGSGELWDDLKTKYSILLPDITKHVKAGGKMAAPGQEFDYRPELKKLKTALLTWVVMNENGLGIEGNYINNESKVLVNVSMLCLASLKYSKRQKINPARPCAKKSVNNNYPPMVKSEVP
jgi:hypothetical protein